MALMVRTILAVFFMIVYRCKNNNFDCVNNNFDSYVL